MKICNLFGVLLFALFSFCAAGQVGNGTPIYDIEVIPKCNIAGTDTVSFYTVQIYTVGNNTPSTVGNFAADGSTFTIPGGSSTTLGYCGGGSSGGGGGGGGSFTPASDTLDFEVLIGCDSGTSYYDVVSVSPSGAINVIGTFDAAAAAYSPATRSYRPCTATGYQAGIFRRRNITTNVSISGTNLISLAVANVGITTASIELDGQTSTILPGQEVTLQQFLDPVTGLFHIAETVTLTPNGSTLHVFEQRNQ